MRCVLEWVRGGRLTEQERETDLIVNSREMVGDTAALMQLQLVLTKSARRRFFE